MVAFTAVCPQGHDATWTQRPTLVVGDAAVLTSDFDIRCPVCDRRPG